jgi:glucokinase
MGKIKYILGLDVGGTKSGVILGTFEGKVLATTRFATDVKLGFQNTWKNFKSSIQKILTENKLNASDLTAIGVSCGGPLDAVKGIVYSPPNLPGWDEIHITEMLEKEYGVPSFLQNDAKAGALVEWKLGAGKGTRNMMFCTMGSGFGCGIIINGKLYEGTNGMAGEVGHIRIAEGGPVGFGKAGSFEGFCGGNGIANLAKIRVKSWLDAGKKVAFCPSIADLETLTAKKVTEAAEAGDPYGIELCNEIGKMLGRGLSTLIDVLNPELIVIGSIFVRHEKVIRKAMEEEIEKETIPFSRNVVKIVPAQLNESIQDYAPLIVAIEGLQTNRNPNLPIKPAVMKHLEELLKRHPELSVCEESIKNAFKIVRNTYASDHKLLICGNGGSAADSEHIAGELMKGYLKKRRPGPEITESLRAIDPALNNYLPDHLQGGLATIALTGQIALSTAFNNDVAADMTFAQQLYGYGRKGDTLLGISTSGNSNNVLNAIRVAKVLGLKTVCLTGASGGKMKSMCDVAICVPESSTPYVQELHLPVYHTLCAMWEEEFFDE